MASAEPSASSMDVDVPAPAAAAVAPKASLIQPEDEELAAKCLAQVEFYFNDANLPYDKFLWTTTRKDPSGEGWVDIAIVASFKRMKDYQPKGVSWVAETLRRSESLLAVNDAGTKVRRIPALVPPKDAFDRSIYAKGFGPATETLQTEMEAWFSQYGKVNAVRMRKDESKKFKESVFCEFSDMETAEKFLALEPKPEFLPGVPLLTMSKKDYVEMKMKEKGIDSSKANIERGSSKEEGGSSAQSSTKKFNAFKEMAYLAKHPHKAPGASGGKDGKAKRKREDEEDEKEKKKKKIAEIVFEYLGEKHNVTEEGKVADPAKVAPPQGHVVRFYGAGEDNDWRKLKADLIEAGFATPFIVFPKGETSGNFENSVPFTAETLAALNARGIESGGQKITWEFLEGEPLHKHYLTRANFQAKKALEAAFSAGTESAGASRGGGGGGGRGGGRGGRGGARGGRGGGGRGGGRKGDRNAEKKEGAAAAPAATESSSTSEPKGPRPMDTDKPAGQGSRGATGPPVVAASE